MSFSRLSLFALQSPLHILSSTTSFWKVPASIALALTIFRNSSAGLSSSEKGLLQKQEVARSVESSLSLDQIEINELKIEIIHNIDNDLLNKIGRLRFKIYKQDAYVREDLIPSGIWLDAEDYEGIHAVIRDREGSVLAAARISIHSDLKETPDGQVFIESGYQFLGPVAYLGKIVVDKQFQNKGLGTRLVKSLMQIAKENGAKSAILTTSEKLIDIFWKKQGFSDSGIRATFPETRRPYVVFAGLYYQF